MTVKNSNPISDIKPRAKTVEFCMIPLFLESGNWSRAHGPPTSSIHDLRKYCPVVPLHQRLGESGTLSRASQDPSSTSRAGGTPHGCCMFGLLRVCPACFTSCPTPAADRGLIDTLRFQNRDVDSPSCTPAAP